MFIAFKGRCYKLKHLKEKISAIKAGIVVSVSLSFMLCIYAPFELFLTNQSEFWFDANTMLKPVFLFWCCAFCLSCFALILLRLINITLYHIGLAIGFSSLIAFYIQGNFLIKGLPSFDGATFNWNGYSIERVKSIVLWVGIVVVVLFVLFKFKADILKKVSIIGSICLFLLLSVTLSALFLTVEMEEKKGLLACSDTNEFLLSDDQNLILLVLDAISGNDFEEIIAGNDDYKNMFHDFTYFDNSLAGYPYSSRSVPLILSGQWHKNEEYFNEYVNKSISISPLVTKLKADKYRMGIYYQYIQLKASTFEGVFENQTVLSYSYSSINTMIKIVVRMAGIKYAPWDLKRHCYNLPDVLFTSKVPLDENFKFYDWSNIVFRDSLKNNNPIEITKDKCFRYIHLEGAHVPFEFDENLNIIKNGTYHQKIIASLKVAKMYLERLKESGVYENSAIVIMSDHGFPDDAKNFNPIERMHPVLLVKGINESHAFKVSNAPVSYVDLAEAFVKLTQGNKSDEIFNYKDGDYRERTFYSYHYTKEEHLVEMKTDGQADDFSSMKKTGAEYDYNYNVK